MVRPGNFYFDVQTARPQYRRINEILAKLNVSVVEAPSGGNTFLRVEAQPTPGDPNESITVRVRLFDPDGVALPGFVLQLFFSQDYLIVFTVTMAHPEFVS